MTSLKSSKSVLKGIPALIGVDRKSSSPLYRQIYAAYRSKIERGELRGGEPVASTRELARELRVSRFPVLNAYSQLLAEGYFETHSGSGTFIASTIPGQSGPEATHREELDARARSVSRRAQGLPKFERSSWAESLGAFQVGQPELRSFPIHIWSKLVARHTRELKVAALRYGDPMGLEALRDAIGTYLRTHRGVRCEAGQIMIVGGSQQALDISTRVLLDAGAPVWVEEPGYWLVHHVVMAAGCKAVPIPVDADGLSVTAGTKLRRNARAVYVAPSHQYPLGVTMSASRRFQLLEWARKQGAWIIEDDYDSEYRYDSMPIASLQGLDTNDRVIYTGTFSKVLFPSLRLGYIVIPPDLVERFAAMRQAMDLCPNHSNQAVLAAYIREGHFSRHIRKMRRVYQERRQILVEELDRAFGASYEILGAAAGMHLTLFLGDKLRDQEIAAKAIHEKLWLSALSLSYVGLCPRPGFVLGFGNTAAEEIRPAVRLLKKLVETG